MPIFNKRILIHLKISIAVIGVLISHSTFAVPALTKSHMLYQPDGTSFQARQWGDEWSHGWQTLTGHTLIRNKASNTWYYADKDASGRLIATTIRAEKVPPLRLPHNIRHDNIDDIAKVKAHSRVQSQKVVPSIGTAKLPVVLINFSDTSTIFTRDDIATLIFGTKASDNLGVISGPGSMKEYYEEVSYGKFSISAGANGVAGWYTALGGHNNYSSYSAAASLVKESVQAADSVMDFSQFDSDGDGNVDVVAVYHQGRGQEESGDTRDIWSHKWDLNSSGVGSIVLDGVTINDYIIMPETFGTSGDASTIGVITHEYAHALGLPDLYDISGGSEGIGRWGLMGSGTWNGDVNTADSPAHLISWSKYALGWLEPTIVTSTLVNHDIFAVSGDATAYLCRENINGVDWVIDSHSGVGEYFLMENRQLRGFDRGLPGTGLLITHIDESVISTNSANADRTRPLVKVIEADGDSALYWMFDSGSSGDPFPGSNINTAFGPNTIPNSNYYSGSTSLINVTQISESSEVVTATIACGELVPFASFSSSPTSIMVGMPVTFSDSSIDMDGSIVAWFWDFGIDSSSISTSQNPSYTYTAPGTYTVKLTVTDNDGNTGMTSQNVRVMAPPVASFSSSSATTTAGVIVTFSDSSTDMDGSIVAWSWDFGLNSSSISTFQNPSYTYTAAGTYTVKLTVTDNDGNTGTSSQNVVIDLETMKVTFTGAGGGGGAGPLGLLLLFGLGFIRFITHRVVNILSL
ncbi:MAG TPA: M6 family metalloprotease domain-containing protein [Ectothiorhodospiraceae bacterium]|nr:M6 family metalloprotease domain-containing protein [Ectothiorhodospiraceae bacterium]